MTLKHETERMGGPPGEYLENRAGAVREAVRIEGEKRRASDKRIAEACDLAERKFRRDPTSGHRAIAEGVAVLDRPNNVIPLRRARA